MPTEPVFLRWEHTTPLLVRRWGRIGGKRSRSIRMRVADGEELQRQVALIGRRRQAHGYRLVRELRVAAMAGAAA